MPQISPLSWIFIPLFLFFFSLVFMVGFWWFVNERIFFTDDLLSLEEDVFHKGGFWMW